MTFFRVGQYGTSTTPQFEGGTSSESSRLNPAPRSLAKTAPLVEFSTCEDRASLMSLGGLGSASASLTRRRTRRSRGRNPAGSRRRRRTRTTKVRIVKGKVALRVSGFPQVQRLGASQLVRFVPLNKLRAAAKKVLGRGPRRRSLTTAGGRRRRSVKRKRPRSVVRRRRRRGGRRRVRRHH